MRHDLDLAIAFFQRFKGLDEPAQSLAENFNRLPCAQRKARVDHILARRAEVQVGTPRFRQTGTDLRNEGGDHDPILRYTCLQSGDVGAEAGKQIGNLLRRLLRDRTLIGLCRASSASKRSIASISARAEKSGSSSSSPRSPERMGWSKAEMVMGFSCLIDARRIGYGRSYIEKHCFPFTLEMDVEEVMRAFLPCDQGLHSVLMLEPRQHRVFGVGRFLVTEIKARRQPQIDATGDNPEADMRRHQAPVWEGDAARFDGFDCDLAGLHIGGETPPA